MDSNIYSDYGTIIEQRYIKRDKLEKTVHARIGGNAFGSISIVGLHGVGKTTLINRLLDSYDDIVISLSVSGINRKNPKAFFDTIIRKIYREAQKLSIDVEPLTRKYDEYKECDFESLGSELFLEFLEDTNKMLNKKIIIVLDEFDAIVNLFHADDNYFHILRNAADSKKFNTVFIFISKRHVDKIETGVTNSISTLKGILSTPCQVAPFNAIEREDYFAILCNYINIDENLIELYKKYTGFHPYLMDIVSYYLLENININLEVFIKKYKSVLFEEYRKIIKLIKEEGLYNFLLSFVNGEILPNDQTMSTLRNYGVINADYEIFCEEFRSLLLSEAISIERNLSHVGDTKQIFLSYSSSTNEVADRIEQAIGNAKGMKLVRDRTSLQYKDDIEAFMQTIQESDFVIMLISDGFLRSKYCMREAMMLFENVSFHEKIVPLIDDSDDRIYNAEGNVEYIRYWEDKRTKLNKSVKSMKDVSKADAPISELKIVNNIIDFINEYFVQYIHKTYVMPIDNYIAEDFKTIVEHMR